MPGTLSQDGGPRLVKLGALAVSCLTMTHPDPSSGGRLRAGSQAYLLEKYEELGTFHDAVWDLVHLHDREPDRYRQVTGCDRLPQYETLCKYWKGIPLARRRTAKQRFLLRG